MKKHVLITRPNGQHQNLASALQHQGYAVTHSPALAIEETFLSAAERGFLLNLDSYHAVIFISRNAADYALSVLQDVWPQWPVGVHWLAVGEATAQVLQDAGMTPDHPDEGFNSEALLAMPCLQNLRDKKVLLLRGEGGRELLAPVIRQRADALDEVVLYRRRCDSHFAWPTERVDAAMVTSQQSWECIARNVPADCLVIAGSERIAAIIRADGFSVVAAASPHDADMLSALQGALPISSAS